MAERMTYNEAGDDIDEILKGHNLRKQVDEEFEGGYNLVDALTPPNEDSVKLG